MEMVVIDGVRYRPEDVPKDRKGTVTNKARTPQQGARGGGGKNAPKVKEPPAPPQE